MGRRKYVNIPVAWAACAGVARPACGRRRRWKRLRPAALPPQSLSGPQGPPTPTLQYTTITYLIYIVVSYTMTTQRADYFVLSINLK